MSPRRDIDENVWLRPGIGPGSPDLEIGTLPIELHPADSIFCILTIFIYSIFLGEGQRGFNPHNSPFIYRAFVRPSLPHHLTHPSHYPRSSPLPLHSLWGVGHGTTVAAGF